MPKYHCFPFFAPAVGLAGEAVQAISSEGVAEHCVGGGVAVAGRVITEGLRRAVLEVSRCWRGGSGWVERKLWASQLLHETAHMVSHRVTSHFLKEFL